MTAKRFFGKGALLCIGICAVGAVLFGFPGICGLTGGVLPDTEVGEMIGFGTWALGLLGFPLCLICWFVFHLRSDS